MRIRLPFKKISITTVILIWLWKQLLTEPPWTPLNLFIYENRSLSPLTIYYIFYRKASNNFVISFFFENLSTFLLQWKTIHVDRIGFHGIYSYKSETKSTMTMTIKSITLIKTGNHKKYGLAMHFMTAVIFLCILFGFTLINR